MSDFFLKIHSYGDTGRTTFRNQKYIRKRMLRCEFIKWTWLKVYDITLSIRLECHRILCINLHFVEFSCFGEGVLKLQHGFV